MLFLRLEYWGKLDAFFLVFHFGTIFRVFSRQQPRLLKCIGTSGYGMQCIKISRHLDTVYKDLMIYLPAYFVPSCFCLFIYSLIFLNIAIIFFYDLICTYLYFR